MTVFVPVFVMFLELLSGTAQICNGTTFATIDDEHVGGDSPYLNREILPTDLGIAHRRFPLGSKVELLNLRTNRSTVVRVIDRGPFGMVDDQGVWRNGVERFRKALRAGKPIPRDGWRACVDMTPATAKRIGADGFEPVLVRRVHGKKKTRGRVHR